MTPGISTATQQPANLQQRHATSQTSHASSTPQEEELERHAASTGNGYAGISTGTDTGTSVGNGNGQLSTAARRSPDEAILPDGKYPLSGISVRAFGLGGGFGAGAVLVGLLAWQGSPLWRAPFFVAALCLFHFLEFWTTAAYNTPQATPEAFILTANGMAYNAAHVSAVAETLLAHSGALARWTGGGGWDARAALTVGAWKVAAALRFLHGKDDGELFATFAGLGPEVGAAEAWVGTAWLAAGFLLVAAGQAARSLAMVTAGRSFNHLVQRYRRQEHTLVTTGVYAVLRHPSYFGFFWWAIGTQMVLGNRLCLAAYAAVLWTFFSDRIGKEERYLLSFFGDEYADYRRRTRVGIPGIP